MSMHQCGNQYVTSATIRRREKWERDTISKRGSPGAIVPGVHNSRRAQRCWPFDPIFPWVTSLQWVSPWFGWRITTAIIIPDLLKIDQELRTVWCWRKVSGGLLGYCKLIISRLSLFWWRLQNGVISATWSNNFSKICYIIYYSICQTRLNQLNLIFDNSDCFRRSLLFFHVIHSSPETYC